MGSIKNPLIKGLVSLTILIHLSATRADEAPASNGVEVLARGPVHEGFAEPVDQRPVAGPIVPKKPPAPVDELPPEQKLAGDNVIWMPGYWSWDTDRTDFIWISGFWRVPPPNRTWMPGSWRQAGDGWQWVSGFWSAPLQDQAQIDYLPEPPAPLDVGPTTPAPNDTAIYAPGAWVYRSRYVWRPGYWMDYRPNWIWIPAHYRWTPAGYIFVDGYWDYPLETRGTLFAPAYISPTVYADPGYFYTPSMVVSNECLFGSLFVRRGWGQYYFGDYFGSAYASAGFTSWCGYSMGRDVFGVRAWYDPMYSYYRVNGRNDPFWRGGINDLYVGRYRGDIPLPPRTLDQQNSFFAGHNVVNNAMIINNRTVNVNNFRMLTTINDATRANPNLSLQSLSPGDRREQMNMSRQLNSFAQQRGQMETQLGAKYPGGQGATNGLRSGSLNVPQGIRARNSVNPMQQGANNSPRLNALQGQPQHATASINTPQSNRGTPPAGANSNPIYRSNRPSNPGSSLVRNPGEIKPIARGVSPGVSQPQPAVQLSARLNAAPSTRTTVQPPTSMLNSHSTPQVNPQSQPRSIPQSVQHATPQMLSRTIPQAAPHVTPQAQTQPRAFAQPTQHFAPQAQAQPRMFAQPVQHAAAQMHSTPQPVQHLASQTQPHAASAAHAALAGHAASAAHTAPTAHATSPARPAHGH